MHPLHYALLSFLCETLAVMYRVVVPMKQPILVGQYVHTVLPRMVDEDGFWLSKGLEIHCEL